MGSPDFGSAIFAARDRYSFPSGHTLHAVMFSVLVAAHTPWLLPVVIPLALLIAISRVGLGLHYASDVIAGASMGCAFALLSQALLGSRQGYRHERGMWLSA